MARLILFFICLAVLGFSISARAGLALGALAAVVWCACTVLAFWRVALPPPRQRRR